MNANAVLSAHLSLFEALTIHFEAVGLLADAAAPLLLSLCFSLIPEANLALPFQHSLSTLGACVYDIHLHSLLDWSRIAFLPIPSLRLAHPALGLPPSEISCPLF